jgi:hypothetical protein
VKQEQPTLPEHMGSPPVFSGVRVTRCLVLCVCFVDHCLSFFLSFATVLSAIHFFVSDYPLDMFKFSDNLLVSEIGETYYLLLSINATSVWSIKATFVWRVPNSLYVKYFFL